MVDLPVRRNLFPAAPWVLCAHSLQQMSKGLGWHMAQGVLVAAYLVAVMFTQSSALLLGAAGLELFQRVTYLNLVFITIAGVACFSVCIASERESGTLDLLRLTGLGPLGFLVGRWLPLLLGCSLLLVLQVPCISLAVTLGGVLPGQIWAMMLVSLVHLFLVASVAIWISAVSTTSQRAVVLSFVLFGVWFSGPAAIGSLLYWIWPDSDLSRLEAVLRYFQSLSAFGSAGRLLNSRSTSPALWSHEQRWQVLIGLAALFASWWGFERHAASIPAAPVRVATARPHRRWGTGAIALFWKDFQWTAGGWIWFAIRLVAYPTISLGYGICISGAPDPMNWFLVHEVALRMIGWDTAIVLAQLFQREVKEQTWDALILLPRSRCQICYYKLAGALFALSPGWVWIVFVSIFVSKFGLTGATGLDLFFFASIVVVGCHVAVLVSVLFPRFTWTVALLAGVVAAHFELELSRSLLFSRGWSGSLIMFLLTASVATSVGLHILIAGRIQHLSD